MKRFKITLTALVLTLAFAAVSFANTPTPKEGDVIFRTKIVNEKVVQIQLANLEEVRTVVELKTLNGGQLFRNVIKDHNGYAVRLHLNSLEPGRYVLNVQKGDEIFSRVMKVEANSVMLSDVSK